MSGIRTIVGAACFLFLGTASADAYRTGQGCVVNFDDPVALSLVFANARDNFAYPTRLKANGYPETEMASGCIPGANPAQPCWVYREACGYGDFVNVNPLSNQYGHMHLSFENQSLFSPQACFVDGEDGYGVGFGSPTSGGGCNIVDWTREPRHVSTHASDHAIRIWVENGRTHAERAFDLVGIRFVGTTPVEVKFRKADGTWWWWPSLVPQWWYLYSSTKGITSLIVRGAQGTTGPIHFDLIYIVDTAP
jgi:hypothetical protein